MSRTFKDTRVGKAVGTTKKAFDKDYLEVRTHGPRDPNQEERCPECGAFTVFEGGFLVCTECNWSTFETAELNFDKNPAA